MPLYTPFMTKAMDTIGDATARRDQNRAYASAYMNEPGAMEQLMQLNPQMAYNLQQQKQQSKQQALVNKTNEFKKLKAIAEDRREFFEETKELGAKIETYPEFQTFLEQRREMLRLEIGDDVDLLPQATPEMFEQVKQIYGDKDEEGAAFAGTGMPAQVSSALVRGVNEPEFRNTAEYARAWDVANEPKIIDTEQGRIPLYPKISPLFKPPGAVEQTDKEQINNIKNVVKEDTKVIPGTEKKKTTADEKLSLGFLNRMEAAEANIKSLGKFDSASLWEKMKGITNVTASPELQQYRQAADDWIRSKLRRESGAVIAPEEMAKEYEIYFPQFGDSQPVIDQKKRARAEASNSMKIAAGRAYVKPKDVLSDEELLKKYGG